MRLLLLMLLMCLGTCMLHAADAPAEQRSKTATTPAEAELGRKTAEQIEKEIKLLDAPNDVEKLNAMAAEIAPLTQRPDVVYVCKVLDTKAINAMSIPGGTVYVTKGLLDAVESDHELAGVLAHEIAHNSLYHVRRMMEKQKKWDVAQLIWIVAAVAVNNGVSTNDNGISPVEMLSVSQVVKEAILNGYSVDLETEADMNAIAYLHKDGRYDPVGLYSVLIGFRQMQNSHAKEEQGYIKTHPDPEERLKAARKKFDELHLPVNIWNVVNFRASVVTPAEGETAYALKLGEMKVCEFAVADGELDAKTRAQVAADAINARLTKPDIQLERADIKVPIDPNDGLVLVRMRTTTVFTLTQDDVQAAGLKTLEELATQVKLNIQSAFFAEKVKRGL